MLVVINLAGFEYFTRFVVKAVALRDSTFVEGGNELSVALTRPGEIHSY
jgi:hypothetical protein